MGNVKSGDEQKEALKKQLLLRICAMLAEQGFLSGEEENRLKIAINGQNQ